jgi:hypothetical protein
VAQASSLWGFVLASTKIHRLNPMPLDFFPERISDRNWAEEWLWPERLYADTQIVLTLK